nr:unnamed protein product [Spirometra erinaceieuropaei]
MVPKAATGDWLPADFAGVLFGKSVISKVGLVRAFHQIPIAPEDFLKTTVTNPFDFLEFVRMPFGVHNASQNFQRFVSRVLLGLPVDYAYIDGRLLASSTAEEHMEPFVTVFGRLRQFGVFVNPSRLRPSVIALLPLPLLQPFLAIVNFYHRFLPLCADTHLPLTSVLWGSKGSFGLPAEALAAPADATLLTHFSLDAPISLMVDASNVVKSFVTGCLSSNWKSATITPLFVGGSRAFANYYKPVSLTSICYKIMENIIEKASMPFLERHHLLSDAQNVFRSGRSCLTNLLFTLERWTKARDEGNVVQAIYIDFKKAFDNAPHQCLLYKLRNAGIRGPLLVWT